MLRRAESAIQRRCNPNTLIYGREREERSVHHSISGRHPSTRGGAVVCRLYVAEAWQRAGSATHLRPQIQHADHGGGRNQAARACGADSGAAQRHPLQLRSLEGKDHRRYQRIAHPDERRSDSGTGRPPRSTPQCAPQEVGAEELCPVPHSLPHRPGAAERRQPDAGRSDRHRLQEREQGQTDMVQLLSTFLRQHDAHTLLRLQRPVPAQQMVRQYDAAAQALQWTQPHLHATHNTRKINLLGHQRPALCRPEPIRDAHCRHHQREGRT